MPFVLDNSVVVGWFLEDQATAYTDAVGVLLEQEQAVVPALWELEFANVLRTACRKQRLTADEAHQVIEEVCALPIAIDHDTPGPAELLTLALRYNLSSYDAAYLELALRLKVSIATKDEPLQLAAQAAGVGVVRC